MGTSSSQPAHVVTVRLEPPLARCPQGKFYASIYSAAHGCIKYARWGEPQTLGLWADDIITVTLFFAKSDTHFENDVFDNFAEVHLPWHHICETLGDGGNEVMFELVVAPDLPWLGQHASPAQYSEAFERARAVAMRDPAAARVRVGIRRLPSHAPSEANAESGGFQRALSRATSSTRSLGSRSPSQRARRLSSPIAASRHVASQVAGWWGAADAHSENAGFQGLFGGRAPSSPTRSKGSDASPLETSSPCKSFRDIGDESLHIPWSSRAGSSVSGKDVEGDDRKQVLQLQARSQALRAQLGLKELDLPNVEDHVCAYLESLRQAVRENHELRLYLQGADQDLTIAAENILHGDAHRRSRFGDPVFEGYVAHALALVSQTQAETQNNLAMIWQYDEQIRSLESELASVRAKQIIVAQPNNNKSTGEEDLQRQEQTIELQALEAECAALHTSIAQELSLTSEEEERIIQELQLEHEVQQQEIEHLKEMILSQSSDDDVCVMPGTAVLTQEAEQLQIRRAQEKERDLQEEREHEFLTDDLRRETHALREELQGIASLKAAMELELDNLLQAQKGAHIEGRQREQLRRERDVIMKEIGRSRCRVQFLDQKIELLQGEVEDIRRRAELLWRSQNPKSSSTLNTQAEDLQERVEKLQMEVLMTKRREEGLAQEEEEARQALDQAMLETVVMEKRTALLANRSLNA